MSSSHGGGDGGGSGGRGGRLSTPLTTMAPEAKLAGLGAFLLVMAVTPPSQPWVLASHGLVALAIAAVAMVQPREVARRLVVDLPIAILAGAIAVFGTGPRISVLGVSLSEQGIQVGSAILAKASIGIVVVSAVAASTTVSETTLGLRRLRVPAWLCNLVALTARQLQVLGDELGRIRLAGAVRASGASRARNLKVLTRSLGVLLVRSVERTDRLQVALAARGGGSLATLPRFGGATTGQATSASTAAGRATTDAPRASAFHWAAALGPAACAVALRLGVGG